MGPVLSILRYEDLDEAVEIANDTHFGLGGLVFSSDAAAAQAVADRMDTGSVGINFFTFKSIHRRSLVSPPPERGSTVVTVMR